MKYKDFEADIEFDKVDNIFVGTVINTRHSIAFHGSSINELESNFHDLIDFHIKTSAIDDKPYSGNLMLRINPKIHAQLANSAKLHGVSINKFVSQKLSQGEFNP